MAILNDFESDFVKICNSNNKTNDPNNKRFIKEITNHLIKILAQSISQMGEFSFDQCEMNEYKPEFDSEVNSDAEREAQREQQREWLLALFGENRNALDWLLSFVTSKLINWDVIIQNTIEHYGGKLEIEDVDFGVRYYVSHYLTIALHILFSGNNKKNNSKKNNNSSDKFMIEVTRYKDDLFYFNRLMWQFSIYNVCYPFSKESESFYLAQFTKC